jgi:hypothetical protein
MTAFEIVTYVVTGTAILLALTSYFRPSVVLSRLGREGQVWFDHAEDISVTSRPSEDDVDEPLPRRPLRTRAG